jgi:hypothetical protein
VESDQLVIRQFAETLMQLVRDQSISDRDRLADGRIRGPLGDRWRQALGELTAHDAVKLLIPDLVDQVLFHLMDAIDNEHLPLVWQRQDQSHVSLAQAGHGEMAGWVAMVRTAGLSDSRSSASTTIWPTCPDKRCQRGAIAAAGAVARR